MSRRRHKYKSFHELCASIPSHLNGHTAVLDGEMVCLDQFGRSQFYDLIFRRGSPFYYSFDLLWLDGEDLRPLPLLKRKTRLRKLIGKGNGSRLLYLDPRAQRIRVIREGLRARLEGIVAKWKSGQYVASDRRSSWVKIKNPTYSQVERREELFQRV